MENKLNKQNSNNEKSNINNLKLKQKDKIFIIHKQTIIQEKVKTKTAKLIKSQFENNFYTLYFPIESENNLN